MQIPSSSDPPGFGDALRHLRIARGMTQEALAERASVSVRAISDLERGARTFPYRETAKRLADALDLADEERAVLLSAARRPASTASRGTPAPALRQPVSPLAPLIGREADLQDLTRLMRVDGVRLLTLTGPAGVGKTSLALTAAAALNAAFRDGIVVVDLAPLSEAHLLLRAIAAALELSEQEPAALLEALGRRLSLRQMLLVLDNFEHLLSAAPVVGNLLRTAPGLQVMVTSRAPLRLRGEREFAVAPLRTPERDADITRSDMTECPAIALFVERAQAVDAGFQLTTENVSDIVAICHQLDGLPLAIELAAARIRLLTPAALRERLAHRLPLLTTGPRDAPERHRTLRAALAWSHDLLNPDQQTLLRHLAVFSGGWTLEAAEFVGAATGVRHPLDVLEQLVEQSLVVRDPRRAGLRYYQLETIREFALEDLEASGEGLLVHQKYLAFLTQCARANDLEQMDADIGARLDRLKAELTNLIASLEWAIPHDPVAALTLLADLDWFWFHADRPLTGLRLCERMLATAIGMGSSERLRVAAQAAWLTSVVGNFEALEQRLDDMRTQAMVRGDAGALAYVRMHEGDLAASRGDFAQAMVILEGALQQFQDVQDPWGTMICLNILGIVAQDLGVPDAAVAYFSRISTGITRSQLPAHFQAHTMANLATAYRQLGQQAKALAASQDALRLASDAHRPSSIAAAQGELARHHLYHDDEVLAARRAHDSLRTIWEIGSTWDLTPALELAALVLTAGGMPERATRLLSTASRLRVAMPYPLGGSDRPAVTSTLEALVFVLGDVPFAREWNAGRSVPMDASVRDALSGLTILAGRHSDDDDQQN